MCQGLQIFHGCHRTGRCHPGCQKEEISAYRDHAPSLAKQAHTKGMFVIEAMPKANRSEANLKDPYNWTIKIRTAFWASNRWQNCVHLQRFAKKRLPTTSHQPLQRSRYASQEMRTASWILLHMAPTNSRGCPGSNHATCICPSSRHEMVGHSETFEPLVAEQSELLTISLQRSK